MTKKLSRPYSRIPMFRGKKVIGLGLGQGDTGCQETLDVDVGDDANDGDDDVDEDDDDERATNHVFKLQLFKTSTRKLFLWF